VKVSESSPRETGHRSPAPPGQAMGTAESDLEGPAAVPAGRRRQALLVLGGVGLTVLVADQITKELATNGLDPARPVELLGGLVYLSLTRNSGAAFSLLSGYTWIFPLIAVAVLTGLWLFARRLVSTPWAVGLGLVGGGVIGNLLDRLFRAPGVLHGHVVDFLSLLAPHGDAWPIFNIADTALVGGFGVIITLELLGRHRDGSRIVRADRDAARLPADRGSQAWPS
jgi:signal peptidase II